MEAYGRAGGRELGLDDMIAERHGWPGADGVRDVVEESSGPLVLETAPPRTGQRGRSLGLGTIVQLAFRPAAAIGRLGSVSMPRALGVHLLAVAVGLFVIGGLAAWSETDYGAGRSFSARLFQLLFEIAREFQKNALLAFAVAAGIAVLVESAFLGLAFLMMPWGAGDERLRDSGRNALGRVWLCTPRVLFAVFVVGFVQVEIDRAGSQWWRENPVPIWPAPPTAPTLAVTDPGYAQAQAEYEAALAQHQKQTEDANSQFRERLRTRPWYLRNDDEVGILFGSLVMLWLLWGTLTAVAVPRELSAILRPPMCEQCGYNLTTMPMDSRCPECGLAVEESLGAHLRPGCAWNRRSELGLGRAIWHCTRAVASDPARFGRQLQLLPARPDHRSFLAWHLPLMAFVGSLTVVLCALADFGWSWNRMAEGGHLLAFVAVAPVFATFGVVLISLTAGIVGVWERVRHGRNVLSGAIQVACYSAGRLTLVAAGSGIWLSAIIWLDDEHIFKGLEQITRIDEAVLAALLWLGPTLILFVRYRNGIVRGTAAMRYANLCRRIGQL